MNKRQFLATSAAALLATRAAAQHQVWTPAEKWARLVIVGGAEDRVQDRVILRKFIQYAGGPLSRIRLITAASGVPDAVAASYAQAFGSLGVQDFAVLPLNSREDAFKPQVSADILQADGVFMSGGDQSRLMQTVFDTPVMEAMHKAFHFNHCCIGGTSAGAAVMSRHMIAQGAAVLRPRKDIVETDIGMGFLPSAVVDQHFSERRRLPRLLSTLAGRPDLLGVGIDEDTALVVERARAIEVFGKGTVTLVDMRQAQTNARDVDEEAQIEMLGVQLHTLPAGHRYSAVRAAPQNWPAGLQRAIEQLVKPGPVYL